ncbi:ABC transporter substrate-binding protein [Mesorhizobium shangrilense]|uniref:ABC transporter substrate-binding protein n=1 Tax=Mesorhizobium shangrilense TaxID=460060 RepID=A0ABV2DEA5_9HYPH
MNRRQFLASTSAITLAAGLGLGAGQSARAAESEAVLVLSSSEVGAPNQDPIRASLLNTAAYLIYDRLVEQDVDQSYHPHLAESWETSADGMSWTFKLRQGVRFHDGEPFNAATVTWWIAKYRGSVNDYLTDAIDHAEAVDEHTVRFVMKRAEPNLIYNLASSFMGIPSPKSYDAAGDSYGVNEAIGTGPYKLESLVVGQETVLVANEDYAWGSDLSENKGAPYIKRLSLREIPDASTAFLELKTGGVGMLLGVPDEFLPQMQADKNIGFRSLPGFGVTYLMFNSKSEPFSDMALRQATALAIDQSAILKSVFSGVGLEAHQFLISSLAESKVEPKFEIRYDIAKANELLDKAGWARGSDGIRAKDGKALKIKLSTQSETEFRRTGEIVQAQLKALGMDVEIVTFDSSTIRDHLKKGEHQLAVRHYDWNNADILDWFYSSKNIPYPNSTMWDDPKSQELHDIAMHQSKTGDERVANFLHYHERLLSQFAFVPVHEPLQNVAFNNTLLEVPEKVRGPQLTQPTFVDMKTVA